MLASRGGHSDVPCVRRWSHSCHTTLGFTLCYLTTQTAGKSSEVKTNIIGIEFFMLLSIASYNINYRRVPSWAFGPQEWNTIVWAYLKMVEHMFRWKNTHKLLVTFYIIQSCYYLMSSLCTRQKNYTSYVMFYFHWLYISYSAFCL